MNIGAADAIFHEGGADQSFFSFPMSVQNFFL